MPYKDADALKAYRRAYYLANREKLIADAAAWSAAHREEARATNKRWYAEKGAEYRAIHRERLNAASRRYDAAHPERTSADNRTQRLRRLGLTVAAYETMHAAQEGLCASCRKPETHRDRHGEVTRLAVDHNHATGSVRALLCHACNTGIGLFLDDPALLRAGAEYLERFTN